MHEKVFTETGFNNWQKALVKFRKHERSDCHRSAVSMIEKNTKDVGEMLSAAHAVKKAENQKVSLTILSSIRFLAHQGLPLRGNSVILQVTRHTVISSNFYNCTKRMYPHLNRGCTGLRTDSLVLRYK